MITYGHSREQLRDPLAPIMAYVNQNDDARMVVLDDCSGKPPQIPGVTVTSTRRNLGYSAAVNHIVNEILDDMEERLVLVNPDAVVDQATLGHLCNADADGPPIVVPCEVDASGNSLKNVRSRYSPWQSLAHIIRGSWFSQREYPYDDAPSVEELGKPWVPAGTVVSFSRRFLMTHPLRDDMFWIEMSALASDTSEEYVQFEIIPDVYTHTGGSTRGHAGLIVDASVLNARISYVRQYGNLAARNLLPIIVIVRLCLLRLRGRRDVHEVMQLWRMYRGEVEWNHLLT